ncbi:MAG: hypothetical protein GXO29_04990 [Thermotogae bacterium]|nr:hypothetical protein [Thermotogota bacterium]
MLLLGVGCINDPCADLWNPFVISEPVEPVYMDGLTDDGKGIIFSFSKPFCPHYDSVEVLCDDRTTVAVIHSSDTDTANAQYVLDSTFLQTCEDHSMVFFVFHARDEGPLLWGFNLPAVGEVGDSILPLLRLDMTSDTVHILPVSDGYLVYGDGDVRFTEYSGGFYAPLPPDGYSDTLVANRVDTLVVWQRYEDTNIYWVMLLDSAMVEARTLGFGDLAGYRGLDLCFACER